MMRFRGNMWNLVIAVVFSSTLTTLQFGQEVVSLASVKRIQVGSMGQSDEAERFRLLLADELGKVGFATTDDAKTADAVLTGALSVRTYAEKSRARVTVVLKTPGGLRMWGKDFQPRLNLKFGTSDTVKLRAQDVARTLRKDVEEAARGATKP
jgi:hypothetical protein